MIKNRTLMLEGTLENSGDQKYSLKDPADSAPQYGLINEDSMMKIVAERVNTQMQKENKVKA